MTNRVDPGVQRALSELSALEDGGNLNGAIAVPVLVVAMALAVWAFFGLSGLVTQLGLNRYMAGGLILICWMLIFPITIAAFATMRAVLQGLGFTDLQATARTRLSGLDLSAAHLKELSEVLQQQAWRHKNAYQAAVRDLMGAI